MEGPAGVHKRLAAGESWSLKTGIEGTREEETSTEPPVELPAPPRAKGSVSADGSPSNAIDYFAEARMRRNAGDAAGAAQMYQKFLSGAKKDPRRGLAALELGRLKMDQLGDVAGAIAPLSQASRSAGSLGDDALARLARAYARLGQTSSCRKARARYLRTYPGGVHVEQVRTLCP